MICPTRDCGLELRINRFVLVAPSRKIRSSSRPQLRELPIVTFRTTIAMCTMVWERGVTPGFSMFTPGSTRAHGRDRSTG